MEVSIIKNSKIEKFDLPKKVDGNYWITDSNNSNDKVNLINLEGVNGKWMLKSNTEMSIVYNNKIYASIPLNEYEFYYLKINGEEEYITLYCSPSFDKTFFKVNVINDCELLIGNDPSNSIYYNNPLVSKVQAKLFFKSNFWAIESLDQNNLIYVNNAQVKNVRLFNGDIIFMWGLKIIIVGNILIINNPKGLVLYNQNLLLPWNPVVKSLGEISNTNDDEVVELYTEKDYFLRSPRFRTKIEHADIKIDVPPEAENNEEMPLILTMGPMITMAITSVTMASFSLINLSNGTQKLQNVLPTLIMSGAMVLSAVFWPPLTRYYNKKMKKKKEEKRQTKYKEYLDKKRKEILDIMEIQKQIHLSNNISLEDCKNIVLTRHLKLWERKIDDDDFLQLRIGIGNLAPDIYINYPEEKFRMDNDNLLDMIYKLKEETKEIKSIPIKLSLTEKNVAAIVENDTLTTKFLEGLILQMVALHSYEDLKLVIFTSKKNEKKWKYFKTFPHIWNNEKTIRFFSDNKDDTDQICNYLTEIFNSRMNTENKTDTIDYKKNKPYYVIITDNLKEVRNIKIFTDILESKQNLGFSILIKHDKLANLPNECTTFINVNEKQSALFENELSKDKQKLFIADFNTNINMTDIATKLANIPIEFSAGNFELPNTVGFLEMYNVGNIEQLNIIDRWKNSNTTVSLAAPIGYNENGDLFKLDIHEKFHGPHGLVAGMTGSGKSEFLITYILSLAVNYHPNEVQFVIIDYKGGGLAGAFENKEAGIKLPHLAGTITNLDKAEINRSLASIESELRRRQKLFNIARDKLNESTIDIYKYQRLYREGLVDEPVSHLLIISDEFAELKSQQPEFMDQLISTARIGRSLGVHLILATQKPSGVVNDQIWSNSKFKVCLKVQDKSDSQDMIKCPDAALLKQTGRFYLQVGYNEFFALGQAAWCGIQYTPKDKPKKKIDTSINFINDIGYVTKSVDDVKKNNISSLGEELPNIIKKLNEIREKEYINIKKLWLDKIPSIIYVDELKEKYNYSPIKFVINPVIGEYDDPGNQKQDLLTLPLSNEGNAIIYGSSGSGKEQLLSSMIYSTIIDHSPDEVNFYIMDFGAETLKQFSNAPQIGDIILSTEEEKISNLFKLIRMELEKRKKLFSNFGGNYNSYLQKSGKKLPTIIVIINYYDAFAEIYNDYEEQLIQLTREGEKYGIIFVLTTNSTNSIRFKLAQNFSVSIPLQLNDESDYSSIFGTGIHGIVPSKIKGRGLVKSEGIYEFQTATIYNEEMYDYFVKTICDKLKQKYQTSAKKVPILPEIVDFEFVSSSIKGLNDVPIGVNKNDLNILKFDFKSKFATLIGTQDIENSKKFVNCLLKVLSAINTNSTIIIDTEEITNGVALNSKRINNNFESNFSMIENLINNMENICNSNTNSSQYKDITICILGLNKFKEKIGPSNALKLEELLKVAKDTNKINFIFFDAMSNIKNLEYEPWYKNNIQSNYGIYIGNGITDQYSIKLSKTPRNLYDEIEENFGYAILNGNAILIKLLQDENIAFEEEILEDI